MRLSVIEWGELSPSGLAMHAMNMHDACFGSLVSDRFGQMWHVVYSVLAFSALA